MDIGGFQKNSLIDFPGTLACVVFTIGCNFKCPYCHNPELAADPVERDRGDSGPGQPTGKIQPIDERDIFSFLEKRKGLLQGMVITGGEPTLQKDLEAFIEKVRALGFKIKLDSNGSRPGILASLFDKGLIDYTAMDIKTSLEHYPGLVKGQMDIKSRIPQSIRLIMEKSPAYEFRTTCARPFITTDIIKDMGKMIQGADRYVLQNCSRNVDVLNPQFLTDDNRFFSEKELQALGKMVAGSVKSLELR